MLEHLFLEYLAKSPAINSRTNNFLRCPDVTLVCQHSSECHSTSKMVLISEVLFSSKFITEGHLELHIEFNS